METLNSRSQSQARGVKAKGQATERGPERGCSPVYIGVMRPTTKGESHRIEELRRAAEREKLEKGSTGRSRRAKAPVYIERIASSGTTRRQRIGNRTKRSGRKKPKPAAADAARAEGAPYTLTYSAERRTTRTPPKSGAGDGNSGNWRRRTRRTRPLRTTENTKGVSGCPRERPEREEGDMLARVRRHPRPDGDTRRWAQPVETKPQGGNPDRWMSRIRVARHDKPGPSGRRLSGRIHSARTTCYSEREPKKRNGPSGRYWKRSAPVCAALPREARPAPARLPAKFVAAILSTTGSSS